MRPGFRPQNPQRNDNDHVNPLIERPSPCGSCVPDPATVHPDQTLGELVDDVLWTRRYTTYPVVEDGRAVGLLAFRALAAVQRQECDRRRVREAMVAADRVPALPEAD